jgi:hypothetical protein
MTWSGLVIRPAVKISNFTLAVYLPIPLAGATAYSGLTLIPLGPHLPKVTSHNRKTQIIDNTPKIGLFYF